MLDPGAQVGGEHQCAPTAFNSTELAGLDGLIESRSTDARDCARFGYAVSEGLAHDIPAIIAGVPRRDLDHATRPMMGEYAER